MQAQLRSRTAHAVVQSHGDSTARLPVLAAALLLALLAAPVSMASAQSCDRSGCGYLTPLCGGSPAHPVPQQIWQGAGLRPVDSDPLPAERDSTKFNEFGTDPIYSQYALTPFFFDVAPTNSGYIYLLQASRFQVWDPHADPKNPSRIGNLEWSELPAAGLLAGEPKWPLNSISVPTDTDTMAAITGDYNSGITIVKVTDKTKPSGIYEGIGYNGSVVYAATIGGAHYAYLAIGNGGNGVQIYNMDRALALSTPCFEDVSTHPGSSCPGVYVGTFGSPGTPFISGADNLIATSTTNAFPGGVGIWNASDPAHPQLKTTVLPGTAVWGTAMWKDGSGNYWLAARTQDSGGVFGIATVNVSCAIGTCSSAPLPAFTGVFNEIQVQRHFLTFSRDGSGTPFVYVGSDDRCGLPTTQREWLFDMSNPAAPHDVTPPPQLNGGALTGYWGWYYRSNPTGFNLVSGRHGVFVGEYFYRAAWEIFDIHQLTVNLPPVASFTYSPQQVYPGVPVVFTDTSSGGTHSSSWTFSPDGTPGSSNVANPSVTFAAKGAKTVTLIDNAGVPPPGSSTAQQTVNVLDPVPVVQGVTVSPASPLQCQTVTLTANATGQPALSYSWTVLNAGSSTVATGTTNPLSWATGIATPAGSYTAKVTVSNGAGSANFSQPVTVGALAALPPSTSFAPTNDSFTAGSVNFHTTAAGATQWFWDFGDGTNSGWVSDPVAGPNPTHVYQAIGDYSVTVKVQNCTVSQPSISNPLVVHITQTTPLKAAFQVEGCQFGFCAFTAGTAVTFTDLSTGASFWDYDWDGSGQFADANHTSPVTSHVYSTPSPTPIQPRLRVRRGANESNIFTFTKGIIIQSATPPSISVIGPGQGTVGSPVSFVATASNCTPAATWNWSITGGGSIVGSSTGASVAVTWSSAGSFSATASNSGCSGVQGTAFVSITGGSGGGGALTARFTFQPTAPKNGDTVSFDASSSSGGPQTWVWNFGDGASGNGAQVSHPYTTAGSYTVSLTETAPGSGAGCVSGICVSQANQLVVVSGPPPPPPLDPTFGTSVQCVTQFGFNQCQAGTGQTVTLTANENRATGYAWDFGDGSTGSGASVHHSWSQPGNYAVKLTVSAATFADQSKIVTFVISGPPPVPTQNLMLPWIASSRGALAQSSDLYLYNPDTGPVDVTLTFLKRGLPENPPPQVTQTLQPGQTLFAPNVLSSTFNRENVAGFVTISAKTKTPPILTAFNTTQNNGLQFGQTLTAIALPQSSSSDAPNPTVQELIGLSDDADQFSYFGISNPNATNSTYHLRFFDSTGALIGDSGGDVLLGSFGQRQYQVRDIRRLFGVSNTSDYRIEVDTTSGGQVYPFAANVRFASQAPAFVGQGQSSGAKLYLIGVTSSANWQSDALVVNTGSQPATSTLSYVRFGVASRPAADKTVTLQPGETRRLANVVSSQFGLSNSAGVLTVASTSGGGGLYPLLRGETFNIANPGNQFGQGVPASTDAEAAAAGQSHYLVGLRQDANNKTTLWLFNPGSEVAVYDIVYRGLDGSVLQTVTDVATPPGRLRQYLPSQLPLPAAGVPNGFTVQVNVHNGTVLAAAQVVSMSSGAPAYIKGATR
jgi:PKD repeat protein